MLRENLLEDIIHPIELLIKENSGYTANYFGLYRDFGKVVFIIQIFNNLNTLKTLKEDVREYRVTIRNIIRDCFLELYCRAYGIQTINIDLLRKIIYQVQELLIRKNSDYGDSYFELREEFGKVAFLIRLTDKVARLKTLAKQQAQVEESEEDTIKDIIGYCLLELYYRHYGGKDGMDKDKGWQE